MTPLGFATGLSLNQAESQPVKSNQDDVRVRTPAFGLTGIRAVIIGIRLQTWMRVIVGVDL